MPSTTYYVTGTGDSNTGSGVYGDLRYCIAHATSNSDTIEFSDGTRERGGGTDFYDGTPRTITLSASNQALTISHSVTIVGPVVDGTIEVTVKRGTIGGFRIFDIGNGTTGGSPNPAIHVFLSGLEVNNGLAEGGIAAAAVDGEGGGVRFIGTGGSGNSLTIANCLITGNRTDGTVNDEGTGTDGEFGGNGLGGGIYTNNVAVTITDSTVSNNHAKAQSGSIDSGNAEGGGLYSTGGSVTISRSTFTNNLADAQTSSTNPPENAFGGGISTQDSTLEISDSTISDNTAQGSAGDTAGNATGGGLSHAGSRPVTLTRVAVAGNVAQGGTANVAAGSDPANGGMADGGGLALTVVETSDTPTIHVVDCEVDNNEAAGGPATVSNASREAYGGAAQDGGMDSLTYDDSMSVTANGIAEGCTFAGNQSVGGLAVFDDGPASSNYPVAIAGPAYAGGVTVSQLVDSTVALNTALGGTAEDHAVFVVPTTVAGPAVGGGFGGGPLFASSLPVTYSVFNDTIVGNFATPGPGDSSPNLNYAQGYGGGIGDGYIYRVIDNMGNTFSNGGPDHSVAVYSTIVAENYADVKVTASQYSNGAHSVGPDIWGASSLGYNLVGFTDSSNSPDFVPAYDPNPPHDIKRNSNNDLVGPEFNGDPYDPGLAMDGGATNQPTPLLAYNGGFTKTIALEPNGNSVDNGENDPNGTVHPGLVLSYDQRDFPVPRIVDDLSTGVISPSDLTDIGAFEVQQFSSDIFYADTRWISHSPGDVITDADPVEAGDQEAIYGYNAFSSVNDAIRAADTQNPGVLRVVVNGANGSDGQGVFHEDVVNSGTVPVWLQYGPVTFDSLAGDNSASEFVLRSVNLTTGSSGDTEYDGHMDGSGELIKVGSGKLTLTGSSNYNGGTDIEDGILQVSADAALGTGNVVGNSLGLGVLTFDGPATTTTKSFAMGTGTINATDGTTVTCDGGTVSAAALDGSGEFTTSAADGAVFIDDTSMGSITITSNNAGDQFHHFSNNGTLDVAAGVNTSGTSTTLNLNDFTNQGLGSLTIGASSQVNVSGFQSYGTVTLSPGTSSSPTQLTNLGSSELGFNGGSRTFISVAANSSLLDAVIDLHGQNARVTGGLLKNCGYVMDSVGAGTKTIIADFGSTVKSSGVLQNPVQTVNGGVFQSGDCPGSGYVSRFTFGSGGVNNYLFQITDASGAAGPTPDAERHTDGWSLVEAGDFTWTADSNQKLNVDVQTLSNTTTVGNDVAGAMDNFDPTKSYTWKAVHWTGTYTGPTDVAALNASTVFNTDAFANQINGTFSWQLDLTTQTLSLVYTPNS
jgi:autotransporter-associated beta strand protein